MAKETDKLKSRLRPPTRKEVMEDLKKELIPNAVKTAIAAARVHNLMKDMQNGREP